MNWSATTAGLSRKTNSPYLWSWTDLYTAGKYVADHVYSRSAVDKQPGCVAILKSLVALDADVAARLGLEPAPEPVPNDLDRIAELLAAATAALGEATAMLKDMQRKEKP
jgi:hypothetical protein